MQKKWFRSRFILGTFAASLIAACGSPVSPVTQVPLSEGDELATLAVDAYVAHRDKATGLPTFSWLQPEKARTLAAMGAGQGSTATLPAKVAKATLRGLAKTYRLSEAALKTASLREVHDVGNGPLVAHFNQQVDGLDVFRTSLKIGMDRTTTPMMASGSLAVNITPVTSDFALDETAAVAAAFRAMKSGQVVVERVRRTGGLEAGYAALSVQGRPADAPAAVAGEQAGVSLSGPARSKRLWYPGPRGLIPAYYVELSVGRSDDTQTDDRAFVVSAIDGQVLFEKNQVASDAFTYRVWADSAAPYKPWDSPAGNDYTPHPTRMADGKAPGVVASQLVTLQNAPFNTKGDPWLPADATNLDGNNAFVYADLAEPDGFSPGDLRINASAPKTFDFAIDPAADTTAATAAAAGTHLFYVLNFMHDYFYDAGWNEISGNPQRDNLGRGGIGSDAIKGEAQDSSRLNNANASTQADGAPPRIQMFLWTPAASLVTINAPADLAGKQTIGSAAYNPKTYDVTGDLVLVDDGVAPGSDGCTTPFTNAAAVAGKIALIDRGTCGFAVKSKNAQLNGAVGVVLVNNVAMGGVISAAGSDPTITIPTIGISKEDGDKIKAKLMAGTAVNLRMVGGSARRDGSLDTGIVAHEWGHILSNRLIGDASGLSNIQGYGMGEGWSDFVAQLTLVRPEDVTAPGGSNWTGAYPVGTWAENVLPSNIWYEGIRRYPYSADLAINPLTFKHIQDGTALPTMPPPSYGADGSENSEVHNTGEVWASMLWDCYVALLRDTARYTFDQANLRMRQYLIASLKMTPNAPTMLEARDALLATALSTDQKDFELFWAAFARRGMGAGAVGPASDSLDNVGVTESMQLGNAVQIDSVQLDDSGPGSCDHDGALDNGETGKVRVKVRNVGVGSTAGGTVKLTANVPAVTFGGDGTIALPALRPFESATVTLDVTMTGAADLQKYDVTATAMVPNAATATPVTSTIPLLGNYDDVPQTSATETANSTLPLWVASNISEDPDLTKWERTALDYSEGVFHGPDEDGIADRLFTSPPLQVAAAGSLSFTIKHRYDLETDTSVMPTDYYDGARIELSDDGGTTWQDLGPKITMNGYTGTVVTIPPPNSNPLAGKLAYTGQSAGYTDMNGAPGYITSTVDLGTTYQGKTVQVRFRLGTDPATGAGGWDIDEIAFTGLAGTPFVGRQAHRAMCSKEMLTLNIGGAQRVPSGFLVQLGGTVAVSAGRPITYKWTQTAGPTVQLSSDTGTAPTFTAPTVTEATVISLQLLASDGVLESTATVDITVVPAQGPMTTATGCSYGGLPATGGAAGAGGFTALALALAAVRRRRRS